MGGEATSPPPVPDPAHPESPKVCTQLVLDSMAARVGIRELRARLASHLESATPIEVTRHGRTIGLYVPLPHDSGMNERERLLEAGRRDVTPISGPVPMRAGGVIKPPSIAGGLPGAYAPGEPSAVCSCCTPSCVALPITLLPVTMRIAQCSKIHLLAGC